MFESSDAWIFLAVARADGGVLSDVIAAAEYINCTSPCEKEVSGGISRLSGAGLIRVEFARYHLTERGEELFGAAGGMDAGPRTQFDVTRNILASFQS